MIMHRMGRPGAGSDAAGGPTMSFKQCTAACASSGCLKASREVAYWPQISRGHHMRGRGSSLMSSCTDGRRVVERTLSQRSFWGGERLCCVGPGPVIAGVQFVQMCNACPRYALCWQGGQRCARQRARDLASMQLVWQRASCIGRGSRAVDHDLRGRSRMTLGCGGTAAPPDCPWPCQLMTPSSLQPAA